MTEVLSPKEKRTALAKRSPYLYRLSVISIFREAYNDNKKQTRHPLGSLKGIVKDMASYADCDPDDLKGSFSKKLDNILSGKTEGDRLEDVDHFELIEEFVWRHETEKVTALDIGHNLFFLNKFLQNFWDEPTRRKERSVDRLEINTSTKSTIYEVISPLKKDKRDYSKFGILDFYLAIIKPEKLDINIALLFRNDDISSVYYGIYLEDQYHLITRSVRYKNPMCFSIDQEGPRQVIKSTELFLNFLSVRASDEYGDYQNKSTLIKIENPLKTRELNKVVSNLLTLTKISKSTIDNES